MSIDERLPNGWAYTVIGEVCSIERGITFPSEAKSAISTIANIACLRTANVQEHVNWDDLIYIPKAYLKNGNKLILPDDILISMANSRELVGKVSFVDYVPTESTFGAFISVIRAMGEINRKFLFYYFRLGDTNYKLKGTATQTVNIANLSLDSIYSIDFPLAPLPEQSRIVAAIEQQFTRLDNAVASLQSAQARIKQYRSSLLKSAVDGELTKEWRTEHPAEETGEQLLKRILAERCARWEEAELAKMRKKGVTPKDNKWKQEYKEPEGPTVDNLPELPEGWCWATVEQVAQIQGGIQKQPSRAPRQNAYPYLRVANVLRGRLDLSIIEKMELFKDEIETLRLKTGDLLIVEGNGSRKEIGRSALWNEEIKDCVHQNHIIRVRLNHIMPKYVDFYWNSPEGNRRVMDVAASTTGLYTLSVNKISRLPIPLPPLAEQVQIVANVEASISNIAKLEEAAENNLKRAESERQSILQEAFAGRLVPQDPNDEPANVLLENIREERKKREELEKVVKASRKGDRMGITKRRNAGRIASDRRNIGLYEKIVEAGQPLSPEDLFKGVGLRADAQPESVEEFYEELHADVAAGLIEQVRPAADKVLLYVVEHEDANLEEDEETGEDDTIFVGEMRKAREESLPNLDELPEGNMRNAKEAENRSSLWDE